MQIEFNDSEMKMMQHLLDREVRDLSSEIADSDNSQFRDQLRAHRDDLKSLLDRFGGQLPDEEV